VEDSFSREELRFYETTLQKFPADQIRKSETDTDVICPIHGDRHPSLGCDLRRNGRGVKIVLNCRSRGCDYNEIVNAAGLRPEQLYLLSKNGRPFLGCTIQEYADAKHLDVAFLTSDEVGLQDTEYSGVDAIYIPYADEEGDVVAERFRVELQKSTPDNRFRWAKGAKLTLYGRHRLDDARASGYLWLVEGESDTHVAWYHGEPCIGVPGSGNWRDEWAVYLDGIPEILVCVEPDEAGEKLWKAVSKCLMLEGRLRRVVFQ
jgi:hypothetical protein